MSDIDSGQLRRGYLAHLGRVAPDRYSGGADDHLVMIRDGMCRCDCIDSQRTAENRMHSLIVRQCEGDPAVVVALRRLVPVPGRMHATAPVADVLGTVLLDKAVRVLQKAAA